jgi:hypothetical protein
MSHKTYYGLQKMPYYCKKCHNECYVTAATTEKNKGRLFYARQCSDDGIFRAWCDVINFKPFHLKLQLDRYEHDTRESKRIYMLYLNIITVLLIVGIYFQFVIYFK